MDVINLDGLLRAVELHTGLNGALFAPAWLKEVVQPSVWIAALLSPPLVPALVWLTLGASLAYLVTSAYRPRRQHRGTSEVVTPFDALSRPEGSAEPDGIDPDALHGTGKQIAFQAEARRSERALEQASSKFLALMQRRRTLRMYSSDPVPMSVVRNIIATAGTAPSGANLQPWTYVVVQNQAVRREVQLLVEEEERINYERRMKRSWVSDLQHLNTNWEKPYLTEAPLLVAVFKHAYRLGPGGARLDVYYPEQSVGISVGLFLAAVQNAGLVTLTSTPMGAEAKLRQLLQRPENERLYLLMPLGYPAADATVPDIHRKHVDEIMPVL